ncbi:MAG: peptide ABC transporter substrate-binding protein [Lachnospiraceae bacterium]|nr:peptide ABC transporter substrate-binding protein [Lachnospiraceae bacterium]
MKKKQFLSLLLVAAMTVGLTACGGNNNSTETNATAAGEIPEVVYSDEESEKLYDENLGEFYEAYQKALAETENDKRYALMAIAEAKLLETGLIMPTTPQGGSYAITRTAPNTASTVLFGGDMNRFENVLVTTDFVKTEDWDALKQKFEDLKGTGTYYETAKKYLADKGYTLTDTYNIAYSADPETWDVFAEWNATLYEPLCNTFDNLVQYDCENVLQPALAESYEKKVNDDGTVTYTFNIRKGVKWVDSQGREYAEVTADDWVAGAEHLFDAGSGIETLWGASGANVLNADAYLAGEVSFDEVGVKAVDDYTLEYTLAADTPFFETMLTYTTFAPLNRAYYKSQGGTFSEDGDEYTSGDYGKSQDNILYCGPYLVTRADAESAITFDKNDTYWNASNIAIKTINWIYDKQDDVKKTYENCKTGVTSSVGLSQAMIEIAKEDGLFDGYVHISALDSTSFIIAYNINRTATANFNDSSALVTTKDEEQLKNSAFALKNKHFRLALSYALDRLTWNEQRRGEDLKAINIANSYTPGDFVQLTNDLTIEINGEETTFAAGTYYGEIMQAQITADGYPMQVWSEEANDGNGGSTGYDGWYNPDEAVKEMETAIEELKAQGLVIDADHKIVLEKCVYSGSDWMVNQAQAYKQSVEATLGDYVEIVINQTEDVNAYYYSCYYNETGAEANFDINDFTGWGPDFGDPCTFLNTLLPDYNGAFTKNFGIY